MSDQIPTPLTDAAARDDFMANHDATPPEVYVSAEFARKLERELFHARHAALTQGIRVGELEREVDVLIKHGDFHTDRSVAAMSIAEDPRELWEDGPFDCPMLVAVKKLREERDAFRADASRLAFWMRKEHDRQECSGCHDCEALAAHAKLMEDSR